MRELLRLNDEIARHVAALEPAAAAPAPEPRESPAEPIRPRTADDEPSAPGAPPPTWTTCSTRSARRTPGSRRCATAAGSWPGCTAAWRCSASGPRWPIRAPGPACSGSPPTWACSAAGSPTRSTRWSGNWTRCAAGPSGCGWCRSAPIFTALHRAVRDAAEAEGKRVRFAGRGGEIRMGPQPAQPVSGGVPARGAQRRGARHRAGDGPAGGRASRPRARSPCAVERRGRWADRSAAPTTAAASTWPRCAASPQARGLLTGGREPDPQELIDLVLRGGISTSAGGHRGGRPRHRDGRGPGRRRSSSAARCRSQNRPGEGATVELSCRCPC